MRKGDLYRLAGPGTPSFVLVVCTHSASWAECVQRYDDGFTQTILVGVGFSRHAVLVGRNVQAKAP